jgi:hypothetical protein
MRINNVSLNLSIFGCTLLLSLPEDLATVNLGDILKACSHEATGLFKRRYNPHCEFLISC